jgi:hypothetical protein
MLYSKEKEDSVPRIVCCKESFGCPMIKCVINSGTISSRHWALVDTGASPSFIRPELAKRLGLPIARYINCQVGMLNKRRAVYDVAIIVTDGVSSSSINITLVDDPGMRKEKFSILLGIDFLEHFELVSPKGKNSYTISW